MDFPKPKRCQSFEGCRGTGALTDLSDSGSGSQVYCECPAGKALYEKDKAEPIILNPYAKRKP